MHGGEKSLFERSGSFMTVRHLTLLGTNFEIGQKLGELAIERYGRVASDFLADPLYVRARRQYFKQNYPIHWERVRGVAAAFSVEPEDDQYDLTTLTYNLELPSQRPGCSVAYYPPSITATGRGYLSRNYDFSTGTTADLFRIPVSAEVKARLSPIMQEPYIMEWYPEDGGYSSLAIQSFELMSGTLDGLNSAGLAVSIMADEEAIAELGPHLENLKPHQIVGLHELQVMRFLLDTCATVEEAKEALLKVKQYYFFAPCHYIIADKTGHSFIYENSTGRNSQYVIDGGGKPQVVTNFQVHKHIDPESMPSGPLTPATNAFWRYRTLMDRIAGNRRPFTPEDLKANNACVNIRRLLDIVGGDQDVESVAAGIQSRTLWHSLYDLDGLSVEISFYLGESKQADSTYIERRSEYLTFRLGAKSVASAKRP